MKVPLCPPIDASEFEANRDLATIITRFLCRNGNKGFSSKEIASATGITESDVDNTMLKIALSDLVGKVSGRKPKHRIEDVTVGGVVYYRCVAKD